MALDVRLKAEQRMETWASLALLRVPSCRTHSPQCCRAVQWKEKSPHVPGGSRDAGCAQRQQCSA